VVPAADAEGRVAEPVHEPARMLLVEEHDLAARELAVGAEIASRREALAVERNELRGERVGIEHPLDPPPATADEAHPLALARDDETGRDRLHAARGETAHDLFPKDRRDLVAVEAVEDPPRLLRVDEPLVDLARLVERTADRILRDLVEHHPAHRHLRL